MPSGIQFKTYLSGIHFIPADDLDSDLTGVGACPITSAVHVAERTVAHLLDQLPPLESGVVRELAPPLSFLGYNLGNLVIADTTALNLGDWRGIRIPV